MSERGTELADASPRNGAIAVFALLFIGTVAFATRPWWLDVEPTMRSLLAYHSALYALVYAGLTMLCWRRRRLPDAHVGTRALSHWQPTIVGGAASVALLNGFVLVNTDPWISTADTIGANVAGMFAVIELLAMVAAERFAERPTRLLEGLVRAPPAPELAAGTWGAWPGRLTDRGAPWRWSGRYRSRELADPRIPAKQKGEQPGPLVVETDHGKITVPEQESVWITYRWSKEGIREETHELQAGDEVVVVGRVDRGDGGTRVVRSEGRRPALVVGAAASATPRALAQLLVRAHWTRLGVLGALTTAAIVLWFFAALA